MTTLVARLQGGFVLASTTVGIVRPLDGAGPAAPPAAPALGGAATPFSGLPEVVR